MNNSQSIFMNNEINNSYNLKFRFYRLRFTSSFAELRLDKSARQAVVFPYYKPNCSFPLLRKGKLMRFKEKKAESGWSGLYDWQDL
jgi:hypothetical protein